MPGMQQEDFIAWEKLLETSVQETIAGVEAQEREVQQEERLQERSAAVEAREQEVHRGERLLQEEMQRLVGTDEQQQEAKLRAAQRALDAAAAGSCNLSVSRPRSSLNEDI